LGEHSARKFGGKQSCEGTVQPVVGVIASPRLAPAEGNKRCQRLAALVDWIIHLPDGPLTQPLKQKLRVASHSIQGLLNLDRYSHVYRLGSQTCFIVASLNGELAANILRAILRRRKRTHQKLHLYPSFKHR